MPKVILTAQVQDAAKWEKGVNTHADIFKSYGLQGPAEYALIGNEVAICMEPKDLNKFKKAMEDQATAKAMANDGVKRDTVKMFVLNQSVKV